MSHYHAQSPTERSEEERIGLHPTFPCGLRKYVGLHDTHKRRESEGEIVKEGGKMRDGSGDSDGGACDFGLCSTRKRTAYPK